MTGDDRLKGALADLASLVQAGAGPDHTAESLVALARDNLHCDFAGITVRLRDGQLQTLAGTDPIVEKADRLQCDLGEGPSVGPVWEQPDVAADDIAADQRWPAWGTAAAELGLRSLLATRLSAVGESGALNLYSSQPRRFTAEEVSFAHVFAHQAAVALSNSRRLEQLRFAIDGRTLIGQAQGVLMERFGLSPDQAFGVLRRYSQDNHLKLSHVATELVETGKLRETGTNAQA